MILKIYIAYSKKKDLFTPALWPSIPVKVSETKPMNGFGWVRPKKTGLQIYIVGKTCECMKLVSRIWACYSLSLCLGEVPQKARSLFDVW